jgi:hypothetical protein
MNFQGFSPNSFEQFIRALALKVLGPGVTLFGNGPDGGREATFQGTLNFPFPPSDIWDGYGVIQAKFKETVEDTKKQQAWALNQLQSELNLWRTSAKRNPKPDYFIFCTNVHLTSTAKGGRAACEKALEVYKHTSELKGYAIWDANQLRGYVDGYAEIRHRFSCFLTPGDLIAQFSKLLSRVPDPEAILGAYLCSEILADEDARLSQAGDRSEDRIRLASVFLDLPSGLSPSSDPPKEESNRPLIKGSLHELLRAASHKLDALTLYEQKELAKRSGLDSERVYGRFVLIGGPGSGKSTIGQFLAQIHRAALLARREPHRLEDKVRIVIEEIKACCEREQATWPSTPRYPFRVELNAFAKALAADPTEGGVFTLSEYLRSRLTRDFKLTHEDLRDWLKGFPWLLIFDGLDEVPSSSNRREVVAAIQNFLNEARDLEADLLIVSSSRPDGYAGEFDGDEVAQRYLLPLSKPRALACAQRLVTAKTVVKGDQRAIEAMATITTAIDNPLIAKLMRSPLQVTFMVTVVAASGKPSESRWQLFNDYYRTIYERELHKAVPPFDQVLNERRQDIDALHHRVGFILQYRAEISGGTQAELSSEEFEQLVTTCLEENGLAADDLSKQTEMILGAASLRLVFLTSRTPGKLGFDIRSLQEYMAAACLTNADSTEVIHRLELIAHSAYWRNTLLFGIGRFFAEPQMRGHRDKIRMLCEDLNRKDSLRAEAKLGSRLALEILQTGIIGNVPLFSRSLAACALQLLANPPLNADSTLAALAQIYDSSMENEFRSAVTLWIGQKEWPLTLSAWILTLSLEKKGVQWAKEMATQNWPNALENAWVLLKIWVSNLTSKQSPHTELDDTDLDRFGNVIPKISPVELAEEALILEVLSAQKRPSWLGSSASFLLRRILGTLQAPVVINSYRTGLQIRLNSNDPLKRMSFQAVDALTLQPNLHPEWKPIVKLAQWCEDPSLARLKSVLVELVQVYRPEHWYFWTERLPSAIACCLDKIGSTNTQWNQVSNNDLDLWRIKEKLWKENGVRLEELLSPLIDWSLPPIVAVQTLSVQDSTDEESDQIVSKTLLDNLQTATQAEIKDMLAWFISSYLNWVKTFSGLDPTALQNYVLPARDRWFAWQFSFDSDELRTDEQAWALFYDHFGRMDELKFSHYASDDDHLEFVVEQFLKDPSKVGLLRLAGFLCAAGAAFDVRPVVIQVDQFEDPRYRLAAVLFLLSVSRLTIPQAKEVSEFLPDIVAKKPEPEALEILMTALEGHAAQNPALEVMLSQLAKLIPTDQWQLRARAESLRDSFLQAHPTGLNPQLLRSLELPVIELLP